MLRRLNKMKVIPCVLTGLMMFGVVLLCGVQVIAEESRPTPLKLILVGDIMIAHDEETGKVIERGDDPFAPFAKHFQAADLTVGNLECVVAEGGKEVRKPYNFRAHPRVNPLLKKHFHALSVANNHSGDYGPEAFAEQCDLFDKAGIPYFGGGRDLKAAHTPLIIEKHGLRIAFLGYCEVFLRSFAAGEKRPGCAWSEEDERVLADIHAARETHKADIVIPYMHWGDEHDPATDRQKSLARKMIDAGATCVIGGHPHVVQETEIYKEKPIIYSVGNFVFNGFDTPETTTGWALRMTLDKAGVVEWDTITARIDERGVPIPDLKTKSPAGKRGSKTIEMLAPQAAEKRQGTP